MKLYTAKVRIGGSRDHEVIKHNLTAAEMKVLELIHVSPQGHPVIVEVEHTGNVTRSDRKERARLADLYTKGELVEDRGERIIKSLFGVEGMPLPDSYEPPIKVESTTYEVEDEEDEVITPVEQPVRSRPKVKSRVDELVG